MLFFISKSSIHKITLFIIFLVNSDVAFVSYLIWTCFVFISHPYVDVYTILLIGHFQPMRVANSDFASLSVLNTTHNHYLPPASAVNGQFRIMVYGH